MSQAEIAAAAEETSRQIGLRVRALRQAKGLTLQALSEVSGLSASMLSMIERGQASPSLLSLSALAHCLGSTIPNLISEGSPGAPDLLTKFQKTAPFFSNDGVLRRVLCLDETRKVEVTWNVYAPGIGNHPDGIEHQGFEYGLCVEGALTVSVEGQVYEMEAGDLIHFASHRRHRIFNAGQSDTIAVWFNLLE